MATFTLHWRYCQVLLFILWFIHRTHSISAKPLVMSSSLNDYLFPHTDWPAFHDKENPYLSEMKRRGGTTNERTPDPSESISRFLQYVYDTRYSQHQSLYDELDQDFKHRLHTLIQDIANLVRTTSKQYRQRQRKNAKLGEYIRGNTAKKLRLPTNSGIEEPYRSEPSTPKFEFPTNDQLPSTQTLPYQPRNSPSKQLPFDSLPPEQPRGDRILPRHLQASLDHTGERASPRAISSLPTMEFTPSDIQSFPVWQGSEPPPSITVQVIDANFREIYDIEPSPNYHLLNLLTDLLSRQTRPLDIRLNKTDGCLFIETIDGLGQVDSTFEWRIMVNDRQDEEIWNSQCMPPETLKLRFGYDVIFTFVKRYGLPERNEHSHDTAENRFEDTFNDLL